VNVVGLEEDPVTAKQFLSDKQYNRVKFFSGLVLPAAGTLYFALATIWHLPAAKEILGTIVAVQAFFGVLLGVSSNQYKESNARFGGVIRVVKDENKVLYSLDLNDDPVKLKDKHEITFKVENE
jgi:hypothetical protein